MHEGQEPEQTCALRALIICDGHQLELPDHALTRCLCELHSQSSDEGDAEAATRYAAARCALVSPQLHAQASSWF